MEAPKNRRRRPALSCIECRRRKVRCDRVDPCKHCIAAKIPCSYKPDPRRSGSVATGRSAVESLSTRPTNTADAGLAHPSPYIRPSPRTGLAVQSHYTIVESYPHQRPHAVEPDQSTPRLNVPVDELLSIELNAASYVPMKKTRIAGWSDRVGNDMFSSIFACYKEAYGANPSFKEYGADPTFSKDSETRATVSEIGELLQKSKRISKRLKPLDTTLHGPPTSMLCVLPPRHTADAMVDLYLDTFESAHRILHVPTFRTDYERYWAGGDVSEEVRLTILLVLAIGSRLLDEHEDSISQAQYCQWIYAAQTWLLGFDKHRLSIEALQLHCLTLLARQILCVGGDLIWISVGSLLHQAMLMGLHRDPSKIKRMDQLQAEIRRRLWATILDMTLQCSLDRALPPPICLDDYDTAHPANFNDHELSDPEATSRSLRDDCFTDASIQRLLLKTLPLRLRIAQLLNSTKPRLHYPEVLSLSQELVSTCHSSNSELKEHGVSQFRCNLLAYLQQRFLLPLHCLFANQSRSQPLFLYSLKVNLDVAASIAIPSSDVIWNRLMRVAGGMFREGIRYASITVAMEVVAQAQINQNALGYGAHDRELCKKLMQHLLDASMDRIRYGESNVKNPMFLSMVMTQAKAIEEGRPTRLTMAQAARDSLRQCYEILEARKNGLPSTEMISSVDHSTDPSSFDDLDNFDMGFDLDFFMPDMML